MRGALVAVALVASAGCGGSSIVRTAYEQTYLRADHNWSFRESFPDADHLLNAFDYSHAIVYETLITHGGDTSRLENKEFGFITTKLLRHPPSVPLEEAAIGPDYATMVPEVVAMFDWAHMLHRQIYDVWSAPGTDEWHDAETRRVIAYYRSRRDLAFSARPKSMALMEGQSYSLAFRRLDPKFNGLLWSYHWFQMALYDALIDGHTYPRRRALVDTVEAQFFRMLGDAPRNMPSEMPMSPASASTFSARYPDAAIIFDNLHSLHDVVSDILVSPVVPKAAKRSAILAAAAAYRDDTTAVISHDEWRGMSLMMAPKIPR
ncbi:MAG TPA: hypothetical protein VHV78_13590 [Gemmatimonadaceae bacterium]|nr:hypothetical protein [Gemmatimonadaceae bacterium]